MSSFFPHVIADISNLPWVAIIAVGGGMLLTIVVIVGGLMFAHQRQKLWHETARLALEKGQPLPSGHEETAEQEPDKPGNDIRSGLILIAVGVGLYIFLNALVGRGLGLLGAIPGLIGVALLLFGVVHVLLGSKKNPPSDQPRT